MRPRFFCLCALLAGAAANAQGLASQDRIRALGSFDEIAKQCAVDGTDADVDAYRLKLWHAYLVGEGVPDTSAQRIRDIVARLRAQVVDDVTDESRRQYKAARAAIPDVEALSATQQAEFHRLCESPRVQGTPGPR